MKSYLFFDTETTGLPVDMAAPVNDFENWPRVVQLAWVVFREDGKLLLTENATIKPNGFVIPQGMIHGISHEMAEKNGLPMDELLWDFLSDLTDADYFVCHNVDFDLPVLACEFLRYGFQNPFNTIAGYCTQKQPTNFLKIPANGKRGYGPYKWPSLKELHEFCFGTHFENAHNAQADVEATVRCFFYLKEKYPEMFAFSYTHPFLILK